MSFSLVLLFLSIAVILLKYNRNFEEYTKHLDIIYNILVFIGVSTLFINNSIDYYIYLMNTPLLIALLLTMTTTAIGMINSFYIIFTRNVKSKTYLILDKIHIVFMYLAIIFLIISMWF